VLVSLDRWAGVESADRQRLQATIRAGSKLCDIGEPLREHGMALANQGDVDVQSLAGAVSTGTHGTGRSLGSISTQIAGLRLVTADGQVRSFSLDNDAEAIAALRVSLGALGVVTAVTLQLLPAYRLHERVWQEPIDECLARLDERTSATRHFEFFWYPATDLAHAKALHPTDGAPDEMPGVEGQRINHSYKVFPTVRNNRFNEMEYSVPAERGPACFRAIRHLTQSRHSYVAWPIEYRTVAADDIDLSTAHGRETVALSIHQGVGLEYREFFADAEKIFRAHEGRPHWAKMHSLRAAELAPLYPRWDHFHALRRALDPAGVFMNDYLRAVFDSF
jgi:FAD/FMN-containing dehydrogenase